MTAQSKLYYKNDKIRGGNQGFFYLKKVLENIMIAFIGISINTIYSAKFKRFKFFNVINIILIKITNVAILPTNIKTFF